MKTKIIFLMVLLNLSAAQATDWNSLIDSAPNAKQERLQIDDNGFVIANVAKLPSGKIRFLNFTSFGVASRATVIVESPMVDKAEMCSLGVHGKEPFKAKLVMETNAVADLDGGFFGKKSKLDAFENRIKVGKAVLSLSKKIASWTLYDFDSIKKSKSVWEYYESVLNEQLQKSGGDTLTMDLTKYNALACDLIYGNIVIKATQQVEYEVGLPAQTTWLSLRQYSSVYKRFWTAQPHVTSLKFSAAQNEQAEALALGIAVAGVVPTDRLLESPKRIQKFLVSVKSNVGGLQPSQKVEVREDEVYTAWNMTAEYVLPENTLIRHNLTSLDQPVTLKFTK